MAYDYDEESIAYHRLPRPGKISVVATKPCVTQQDLSLAYTPGVAVPCLKIAANPADAYEYTNKGNLVACHFERHRGARPREHRTVGRQTGDGGQSRSLQTLCGGRCLRHRAADA